MTFPEHCELVGGPLCGAVVAWPRTTHARLCQPGTNRLAVYRIEEGKAKTVPNGAGEPVQVGTAFWAGMDREAFAA